MYFRSGSVDTAVKPRNRETSRSRYPVVPRSNSPRSGVLSPIGVALPRAARKRAPESPPNRPRLFFEMILVCSSIVSSRNKSTVFIIRNDIHSLVNRLLIHYLNYRSTCQRIALWFLYFFSSFVHLSFRLGSLIVRLYEIKNYCYYDLLFETSSTFYESSHLERLLRACEKCAVGNVLIGIIIMLVLIIVIFSSRGHSLEQSGIRHSLFESISGLSSLVCLRSSK